MPLGRAAAGFDDAPGGQRQGRVILWPIQPALYVGAQPAAVAEGEQPGRDALGRIAVECGRDVRAVAQGLGYQVVYDIATDVVTLVPNVPASASPGTAGAGSAGIAPAPY